MSRATERFATGAWLSPGLVTFASLLMLAGTVAAMGYLFVTATGTVDALGRPLGTDFTSFWTAGLLALHGQAPSAYDWPTLEALQQTTHGVSWFAPWSYPPVFLLVAMALATLPYVQAYLVWQGVCMLIALAVVRRIVPGVRALLVALAFPAVLVCLGHGQTGFLTGALLAGGVLALGGKDLGGKDLGGKDLGGKDLGSKGSGRQVLAGVLFGLLVYKPQLGVLIPFALAAGGYWLAFVSAAVTVLAAVGVTLLIWGWPVWQAFLDALPLIGGIAFEAGSTGFFKFQSAFALARLWGLPVNLAYGAQAVVSVAVLIGVVFAWRAKVDLRLKGAALITGAMLCSPYMLDYDLVAFGFALAFLAAHGMAKGFRPWEKTLLALGWFMPLVAREVTRATLVPVGFPVLLGLFALIMLRVWETRERPCPVTREMAAALQARCAG